MTPADRVAYFEALLTGPDLTGNWRAANEQAWARLLTALGEPWRYEALERDTSRAIRYMPNFWLPERLAWLEIKSGPPTPGELRAARQLREATGRRVYVVSGWPARGRFAVTVIAAAGEAQTTRPDWSALALCQLLDIKFSELYAAMEAIR